MRRVLLSCFAVGIDLQFDLIKMSTLTSSMDGWMDGLVGRTNESLIPVMVVVLSTPLTAVHCPQDDLRSAVAMERSNGGRVDGRMDFYNGHTELIYLSYLSQIVKRDQ